MVKKILFFVSFLTVLVLAFNFVSAASYDYQETAFNSTTIAVTGIQFYLESWYNVSSDVIGYDAEWLVKHGYGTNPYNVSLNESLVYSYLGDSWFRLRILGTLTPNTAGSTQPQYYNGSSWVNIGVAYSLSCGSSGSSSTTTTGSVTYDGDYSTEAFYELGYREPRAGHCDEEGSTIYEEGVYFYTGELYDVVLYVRNPYQQYLSGAQVVVTRQSDGVVVGDKTTDFSGAALFSLAEGIDYNVSVVKGGYENFSDTLTAIESTYAITIGFVDSPNSLYEGFTVDFSPVGVLLNNTVYNFSGSYNSSIWGVTGCVYSLYDENDSLISSNSSGCGVASGVLNLSTVALGVNSSLTARLTLELNGSENITYVHYYSVKYLYEGDFSLSNFFGSLGSFDKSGFGDDEKWLISVVSIFVILGSVAVIADLTGEPEKMTLLVWSLVGVACVADFMPLSFVSDPFVSRYGVLLLVTLIAGASGVISWRLNN